MFGYAQVVFRKSPDSRDRARGEEDKAKVREAFVEAGRRLLTTGDPSKVSLRRIAAEAGYSPGTIYSYFADSRALYRAVREHDMENAMVRFTRIAARTQDPAERVRKLFAGTVRYWRKNPDQFDVMFAQPAAHPHIRIENDPFGKSSVVVRCLDVYYDAIDTYLNSLPAKCASPRLAGDALLASVYGIITFTRMTPTMDWSKVSEMVDMIVNGMLMHWSEQAHLRHRSLQG